MNSDFPRILTLLRKEKGLSQKSAAADLHISQALLSHYEKGIRECGLEFVVNAAAYYGVSCDYLLGRSPDRTGARISVEDIPEPDAAGKGNVLHGGSLMPVLNKKLIANSLNIVFDLLQKSGNKELIAEVSNYIMLCVYKMFRHLYHANPKNPGGLFAMEKPFYEGLTSAAMEIGEMKVRCMSQGVETEGLTPLKDPSLLEMTPESLAAQYPLFASSLTNLVSNVEANLGVRKKS